MGRGEAGGWRNVVEASLRRYVLLEPADRAANLPADTAARSASTFLRGRPNEPYSRSTL